MKILAKPFADEAVHKEEMLVGAEHMVDGDVESALGDVEPPKRWRSFPHHGLRSIR